MGSGGNHYSTRESCGELTLDQGRKIFLGELTNWKEVGGLNEPIVPMTRDESISGTAQIFFREFGPQRPGIGPESHESVRL